MINFKNSKGKKYFAGFIAIILVAAMVLSFASLFFIEFLCIHHVIIYRNRVFLSNILVVMTLENAKLYDKMSVSKTFTV